MSRIRSAFRHPIVGATASFLVVGAILLAVAGVYLALNPSVGSASAAALTRGWGRAGTSTYPLNVIRAADGAWFKLNSISPGLPAIPPGTPIGKVQFTVAKAEHGWPRPTEIVWGLTLDQIAPAPGGPMASDQTTWRGLIVQALGHTFPGRYDFPASMLAGAAHGSVRYPGAFILNMGERLWYSPRWSIGPLVIAGAAGLITGVILHRHPRRAPGACRSCGYDMTGLPGQVCPECGRVPAGSATD